MICVISDQSAFQRLVSLFATSVGVGKVFSFPPCLDTVRAELATIKGVNTFLALDCFPGQSSLALARSLRSDRELRFKGTIFFFSFGSLRDPKKHPGKDILFMKGCQVLQMPFVIDELKDALSKAEELSQHEWEVIAKKFCADDIVDFIAHGAHGYETAFSDVLACLRELDKIYHHNGDAELEEVQLRLKRIRGALGGGRLEKFERDLTHVADEAGFLGYSDTFPSDKEIAGKLEVIKEFASSLVAPKAVENKFDRSLLQKAGPVRSALRNLLSAMSEVKQRAQEEARFGGEDSSR